MTPTFTRSLLVAGCCVLAATATTAQTTDQLATPAVPSEAAADGAESGATAGITGIVSSDKQLNLNEATVTAIHIPTGVRRTARTDEQGRFSINTMLVGGPYAVQISQEGYRTQLLTNVFLEGGKISQFSNVLSPATVAVGTRRTDRTLAESIAPVDVVDMRGLLPLVPQTDLSQLLHQVIPSFNSTRQTTADGADHVEPISLRGLAPDQALVLVNGKRRHTTALVNLLGSRGVGSVGYDLNTLSTNGIDQIEVLRDGAAAQYGSDAIAGVININLKSDNQGGNALLSTGLTSAGDGLTGLLSLNRGLKLGPKGFLNLTADAGYRGPTTRQFDRDLRSWPVFSADAEQERKALAAAGKTYDDYQQRNGDARMKNARGLYNLSVPLSERVRFYSFGSYNFRRGEAAALWRVPSAFEADIVESIFPNGYQPLINTRIHDGSAAAGLELGLGPWKLDLSHVLGGNQMRYDLSNTLNGSMGSGSPTKFDAGGFRFIQNVTNATVTRLFPKALAGTNVAFGGEFRTDYYRIMAGEEASYFDYGRGKDGASGGAQGFPGFDPNSAIRGSRRNVAAFADVEADLTKSWRLEGALRFENYSTFGSAFTYKVASRLRLAQALAVRAGFNTGFRAPALQQALYRQVTSTPTAAGGARFSGIFNNESAIAEAAGIGRLRPETSRNISAGLVLTPTPDLTLTLDAYQIAIDRRILLSGQFGQDSSDQRPRLNAALAAANVEQAQFFTNAANTRTRGLDFVATYRRPLGRGSVNLSLAANLNKTTIKSLEVPAQFQPLQTDNEPGNDYIDQRQLSLVESGNPRQKLILSTGYDIGNFSLLLRNFYFGRVSAYDYNYDLRPEGSAYLEFKGKATTDFTVSFRPRKGMQLTAGVNNVFNVYPDRTLKAAQQGGRLKDAAGNVVLPYDFDVIPYQSTQLPVAGRYFYLKAVYALGSK
ncbi:TonB-dependent receptor [Hymenobacter actinosclerus]|uniref:Iron complex outermembrane recepter protein n=1 Tax=Hymenobacter actinosclerus TaxID=82805 RepID=A0A1I0I9Z3_9BACT|nr:TonB-dependent receptor [Hymenobacter actinosclerus]SET93409.1 iron complex outermembrane recepter protein [Hymenobacter actinosclerus]